ncbi:MAG: ester cyclase [Pseudomonadota bacterium]
MSDNKTVSRRAIGMFASDNTLKAEEIFAKTYKNHQEPDPVPEGGVAVYNFKEWKQLLANFHNAFSNASVKIINQIAEDNFVTTQWEITATHSGTYMGATATGKPVTWRGVEIDRFDHDKIVETWVIWNKYILFEAIGLIK